MRLFEMVRPQFAKFKDTPPTLPTRATMKSAGHDFVLREDIIVRPGYTLITWTDVKVLLNDNEMLKIHIRSSLGFKKKLMIANGTGIIDADYSDDSNTSTGGNIAIALYNYGTEAVRLKKGDKVAQGIIENYLVTDDDNVEEIRDGGIGSTNIVGK